MAPRSSKQQKKTKAQNKQPPAVTSNAIVPALRNDPRHEQLMRDLDSDEGQNWNYVVTVLSEYFGLPNLTTRKGLRKCHEQFIPLYKKLDGAYKAAERDRESAASIRLRGGIVGIYAKMCSDSTLRNKLFDAGMLSPSQTLFPLC